MLKYNNGIYKVVRKVYEKMPITGKTVVLVLLMSAGMV